MLKLFAAFLIFVLTTATTFAQTDDPTDDRFPGLPYYSFGSGLGWTTPDSTYQLNLRFRMQNRATYTSFENDEDSIEAAIRRLRLRFDGYVGDPRFLYAIQLSFSPGDVGELEEGRNINIIRDAVMFYRPNRHWNFAFGQTKLPGNRQRLNSSGALQLTDRSINNAAFNIDRDFGIQAYHLNENINRFSYNIKTAISTGEGRNWTDHSSTNLAYTARGELFPLGTFRNNGMFFEGDLVREETPKLLFGGTYHYNQGAHRSQGQRGIILGEPRDLTSIFLDFMLKYRGFAYQAAWMERSTDDALTWSEDGGRVAYVFTGQGFDHQASYLFPSNYELVLRYSSQQRNRNVSTRPNIDVEQISFGVTRYIWEHALKIQTELTFDTTTIQNTREENSWYLRFQVEMGI
jgi:phosphate-selective porin OprO and OprP